MTDNGICSVAALSGNLDLLTSRRVPWSHMTDNLSLYCDDRWWWFSDLWYHDDMHCNQNPLGKISDCIMDRIRLWFKVLFCFSFVLSHHWSSDSENMIDRRTRQIRKRLQQLKITQKVTFFQFYKRLNV